MAWLGRAFSYQANVLLYITPQGPSVAISGRSRQDSSVHLHLSLFFLCSFSFDQVADTLGRMLGDTGTCHSTLLLQRWLLLCCSMAVTCSSVLTSILMLRFLLLLFQKNQLKMWKGPMKQPVMLKSLPRSKRVEGTRTRVNGQVGFGPSFSLNPGK